MSEWKITHDGGRWYEIPYIVIRPDGGVAACRSTLRGARRALRRARKAQSRVVYREPAP